MTQRIYLRTFGCRANQYDTESVRAMVQDAGAEIVQRPEDATLAVFNSCAVTAAAEADLRRAVRHAARGNASLETVIMGCAAARDDGTLAALPGVRHVIGGADLPAVAAALGLPPRQRSAAARQTATRALLRIQDGCDEHCTFCATTLARGANRSRPVADLVREAQDLAPRHPEIVLTGIHIGTYGRDIGTSLGALVRQLLSDVPAVRFRLSSIEATEVDDTLVELYAEPQRLAPHLHAPLQSGSDRVLKRMGRHWYTAATYTRAVERLMASRGVFALGADVIAGFPGENDRDHRATCDLLQQLPFTYLHVFPYSERPGTSATRLSGAVPAPVARARAAELRSIGEAKLAAYRRRRTGGQADVVVIRGDVREGLTEDYLEVRVETPAGGAPLPRGSRVQCHLAFDRQLIATPVTA